MDETVVILDAEPVVRTVVAETLKRAGYVVHATGDIAAALQICAAHHPDLVLTNVFLPGITGHEALRLFKSNFPSTPVLMVSGLPDSDVIRDWIEEKGFDAFPKPFRPEALVTKVQETIAKSRLNQ